jgi:hypothetical protein
VFLDLENQIVYEVSVSKLFSQCQVHEELMQLPDWSSRLSRALLELPHKMKNREKHLRIALTAVADHISSVLQYQHSGTLLSGEVTLVRPADGGEDNCGLTKVTFPFCLYTMITALIIKKYSEITKLFFSMCDITLG